MKTFDKGLGMDQELDVSVKERSVFIDIGRVPALSVSRFP